MSEKEDAWPLFLSNSYEFDSVFPYPEGTHFEFKQTININVDLINYREKWTTIICGLLNSGGGWFIIGIEDTEHKVKGIQLSRKDLDDFKLWVDSLYKSIVLSDGTPISKPATNLTVYDWKLTNTDKYLLVLKCHCSIKKKNVDFQLANGQIYHRLNASTLLMHGEPVYRQSQIYQREKDNSNVLDKFKAEIDRKNKELITKELEKRKVQEQLEQKEQVCRKYQQSMDKEKYRNAQLIREHKVELQEAIRSTSDILYRYYNNNHETKNYIVINVQPDENDIDPDDSQAKNKKTPKGKITALFMVSCGIVGSVMWFADKILLLSI